jgi:glycosyltransferase involved in cell wall biosynthesis
MSKVYVSVICNVYNHEPYLQQALDGFVNQQTKYSYEVLIHDDASTDRSADIIRNYQNKYPDIIKPIYQKENQYSKGIKIGRTFQIPRAKGKYIAFCEGDDYWCDNSKIEKQVFFLESHPEYSGTVHETQVIDKFGNKIRKFVNQPECDITSLNSLLDFPHTTSYLFRNPWIETKPELVEMTKSISNWDKSYAIYMVKRGKVHYFDEIMSCYRYVEDGGTSYQARFKKYNLTKIKVGSELAHYGQIEAYKMDIDIRPHYFRNVCDYALMKFLTQPNKENLKLLRYAYSQSPYSKKQLITYSLKVYLAKICRKLRKCLFKNS